MPGRVTRQGTQGDEIHHEYGQVETNHKQLPLHELEKVSFRQPQATNEDLLHVGPGVRVVRGVRVGEEMVEVALVLSGRTFPDRRARFRRLDHLLGWFVSFVV